MKNRLYWRLYVRLSDHLSVFILFYGCVQCHFTSEGCCHDTSHDGCSTDVHWSLYYCAHDAFTGRFVLCLYLYCDCTCTVSVLVLWLEYRQQQIVACTQVVLVYQIMLSGLHRVCQIIWVNCYTVDRWPLTENGASWLAKSHVVCSCNPPEIIPRFLSNRLTAVNLVWKLTHSYSHTRLV